MILNDQGKAEFIKSNLHQYFDITLQSSITQYNNTRFVNFVLPLSVIEKFYALDQISTMFNDEHNNVIFTSSDNANIYRYEYYQKVFFIRMDPFDSTLRMHIIPTKYDASDSNTGNSILIFKDNKETIDSTVFYGDGGYTRSTSAKPINLRYEDQDQSNPNGFYKFNIKDRVKNFSNIQINLGYNYNNTGDDNSICHWTGLIDSSNQSGQLISKENFTQKNDILIDCNSDNYNSAQYTNNIVALTVEQNQYHWETDESVGFQNSHTSDVAESKIFHKTLKYFNRNLYIEEDGLYCYGELKSTEDDHVITKVGGE